MSETVTVIVGALIVATVGWAAWTIRALRQSRPVIADASAERLTFSSFIAASSIRHSRLKAAERAWLVAIPCWCCAKRILYDRAGFPKNSTTQVRR